MSERVEQLLVDLISEMKASTAAMQATAQAVLSLTEAVAAMAESNLELVDQLVADQASDDAPAMTYMDGSPVVR